MTKLCPAADAPARDWKANPPIAIVQTDQTVYALGDVHGDYDKLADLLAAAKLIAARPPQPADAQWTGGKAVLVCTGDFIDKYNHALEVIAMLRALQQHAPQAGGQVIITMGNHEAEFLAAGIDAKKKSAEFVTELEIANIPLADVAAGRDRQGIGRFMRDLPIAAQVNDWFFCHAGNTHGMTEAKLADQLIRDIDHDGFGATILSDPDSILESRMHPQPWWEPPGANASTPAPAAQLKANLRALGVNHLVIGHQPGAVFFADGTYRNKDKIFAKSDGSFFMIDTGMSRGADNGHGALLKIQTDPNPTPHQTVSVVSRDGTTQPLWPIPPS